MTNDLESEVHQVPVLGPEDCAYDGRLWPAATRWGRRVLAPSAALAAPYFAPGTNDAGGSPCNGSAATLMNAAGRPA